MIIAVSCGACENNKVLELYAHILRNGLIHTTDTRPYANGWTVNEAKNQLQHELME